FARLGGEHLRFLGGKGDDALSLFFRVVLSAPVFGEHFLGFVSQVACFRELLGNCRRARIKRARNLLMHAEIEHHTEEDEERYGDPEFRFGDGFHGHSLRAAATAAETSGLAGGAPLSRWTIFLAGSAPPPLTPLCADSLA